VVKLSTAKATLPGSKQVWRRPYWAGDVVGLREEVGPAGAETLLAPMMRGGGRTSWEGLREASERFAADLAALPEGLRTLDPRPYSVTASIALSDLADEVKGTIRAREVT
jgi:nicotinate phosphoribosyltransferase